jgi:hypothetical protein
METTNLVLGALLMVTGTAIFIFGIFRAMSHTWSFGLYELWIFPVVGFGLVLLGRWMIT